LLFSFCTPTHTHTHPPPSIRTPTRSHSNTQLFAAAAHRAQRAARIAALPRDPFTGLISMPLDVPIARSAFEATFQRQMNYRTDAMRVLALGAIVADRPKFHTDKHIVRVGGCGGGYAT
jgi:hypothetical protein